ncbi:hypothetical protein M3Y99_01375500 [Aphelenchoides fujianensis]|nr:hypothetical protein M3Y99_01375500 [Aphelenchoides fujianensis]
MPPHAFGADWDVSGEEQQKYGPMFDSLGPVNGKLSGDQVRQVLMNSRLPMPALAQIWELADVDKDGQLDKAEFCVALHLVYKALRNEPLPAQLPLSLAPPNKRHLVATAGSRRQSAVLHSGAASPAPRYAMSQASRTSSIQSLNRSVIDSIHDAGSPANAFRSCIDPKNLDLLDMSTTEADFTRFDTDFDGFVNGGDVKEPLIASGLPQMVLAKLWAFVDVNHSGRLNHAQFTLLIQLVKECRQGIVLPDVLPFHLSQWLMTATTNKVQLPQNPKIDELNEEIAGQREERRKAEQESLQLDADTSVKNAEIKNAEIELQTLTATVKQLRNQRVEAAKRLADLDDKILRLESQCEELAKRLKTEEERVESVKEEIKSAEQNQDAEQKIVDSLRDELRQLDIKHAQEAGALTRENAEMERIVDELTRVERHVDTNKDDVERLEKMVDEVQKELDAAEQIDSPTGDEGVLFRQFPPVSNNGAITVPGSQSSTGARVPPRPTQGPTMGGGGDASRPLYDTIPVDPFKSDPFENVDHTQSGGFGDPFAGTTAGGAVDPFGADPFGSSAFTASNASVTQTNGTTATTTGGASSFANFANFAQFAS